MKFEILNLSCGYDKKTIIENFRAEIKSGEFFCLLGSNGVGKTTIFKTILGFLKPLSGKILVDSRDIFTLSDKQRAKILSYVPQAHMPPFAFKVIDIVAMGRNAHLKMFENPRKIDFDIAKEMLNRLSMGDFADRIYTDLSGGERQMVLIARALAQESKVIMLDEPTANLDFGNQVRVLKELGKLVKNGYLVVMTSHSPEHAFYCNAKTALIFKNKECIYGSAEEVVKSENLKKAYDIDVRVVSNEIEGKKMYSCIPML